MRAPKLQIEGIPSQHQCGLVTYYYTRKEEEIDVRPSVYIIEIMDLSQDTLMDSNTTKIGVPEVIKLTVNDTSGVEDNNQ